MYSVVIVEKDNDTERYTVSTGSDENSGTLINGFEDLEDAIDCAVHTGTSVCYSKQVTDEIESYQ